MIIEKLTELENNNSQNGIVQNAFQEKTHKRYKLHFSEDVMAKVRAFCESFIIKLNKFIVNSVGCFLFDIEDDLRSKAFDLIGSYYKVSRLIDIKSIHNTRKANEKFNEIKAEFPLLISETIKDLCDEIPLTAEEFIEDTINWSIDNLMDQVKNQRYNFLNRYKDFSKITESIDQIYKRNLLWKK